ncbi:MAG: 2-isopropylmalate synthase [Candidatus Lokiarchaeota archaeon]|nr:2-isopropylmalate synthase [Candidatus Lokiarchaeota archaeon]MBD3341793.1 2-isopropylmalate synthase [Candidatus Lokiarchaeota archaeon]
MMGKIRHSLALPKKAYFFDTTLRDGEQTPGISFSLEEKISIAKALTDLGIDIIEAGFPVISQGDFDACKEIAKLGLDSEVIGLARLKKLDIDKVIEADMDSIHVFIATSDLHLKEKLRMTKEEVLETIEDMVTYAKEHYSTVLFSAEDATRSDLDYLIKANQTAVECGATRINIPDTVGTVSPNAFGYLVRANYEALPKNTRIAVHCHNDFGLAVASTIAGFENGASEAQTTIMGLGERAGNAAFEETAMSLYALYQIPMNINTRKIFPTAKLVESYCGGKIKIGRLQPLIGQNAFAHESGIHAHAMIKHARAYEPITPDLIGIQRSDNVTQIVKQSIRLGKHTGGHALRAKLEDLGIHANETQFKNIFENIKRFGDKGHEVMEEDFLAIVKDVMGELPEEEQYVKLEELTVLTGSITPTSTVRLKIRNNGTDVVKMASSIGVGPVDASVKAIVKCFEPMSKVKLLEYNIDAVTGGTEALGHVSIELIDFETNHIVKTSATHEDIVMSSVLALLKGLNKLMKHKNNS